MISKYIISILTAGSVIISLFGPSILHAAPSRTFSHIGSVTVGVNEDFTFSAPTSITVTATQADSRTFCVKAKYLNIQARWATDSRAHRLFIHRDGRCNFTKKYSLPLVQLIQISQEKYKFDYAKPQKTWGQVLNKCTHNREEAKGNIEDGIVIITAYTENKKRGGVPRSSSFSPNESTFTIKYDCFPDSGLAKPRLVRSLEIKDSTLPRGNDYDLDIGKHIYITLLPNNTALPASEINFQKNVRAVSGAKLALVDKQDECMTAVLKKANFSPHSFSTGKYVCVKTARNRNITLRVIRGYTTRDRSFVVSDARTPEARNLFQPIQAYSSLSNQSTTAQSYTQQNSNTSTPKKSVGTSTSKKTITAKRTLKVRLTKGARLIKVFVPDTRLRSATAIQLIDSRGNPVAYTRVILKGSTSRGRYILLQADSKARAGSDYRLSYRTSRGRGSAVVPVKVMRVSIGTSKRKLVSPLRR